MVTVPFYGSIFDFTVEAFINRLEEVKQSGETELFIKLSSPGGNPFAGYGIITAIRDFKEEVEGAVVKYRAEGIAASMGAFVTLFVDKATAIEQTHFMVHRAAVPSFMEDEQTLAMLEKVNNDLMKAFKAKIDVQKFKAISKVPLSRFFDSRKPRIDVDLTAQQAKSIGLIEKVVNLSPIEVQSLNASLIAAHLDPIEEVKEPEVEVEEEPIDDSEIPKKVKKMTVEDLKAKHPEVYNSIFATGKKLGVTEEKDRVEAWLAFKEIDIKAVQKGIEAGEPLNQTAMAYFTAAGIKGGFVNKSKGTHATLDTKGEEEEEDLGDDDAKKKSKDLKKFDAELSEALGLKVEKKEAETVD